MVRNILGATPGFTFDDECALVTLCGGNHSIDSFDDSLQSGVSTNCHVGAAEVVVNRPNQAGNLYPFYCICPNSTRKLVT